MKAIFKNSYLLLIIIFLFLISCKLNEFKPSAQVDARINVLVTSNDTLFGLGLYALGSDKFNTVNAYRTGDSDNFYYLEPYNEAGDDFSYETSLNEMTNKPPGAGDYIFDIEFEAGDFITSSDYLYSDFKYPPYITQLEYNQSINQVVIQWGEIVDEGVLKVNLYNLQRELLYSSSTIDKGNVIFTFGFNSNTWEVENPPEKGEIVIIDIIFYWFEEFNNNIFNIQSATTLERRLTWGGA